MLIDSRLPLLPSAAMPGRAAARARRRAELRAGLARVGGLNHLAGAAEWFFRQLAARAVGEGLGPVHFVEMGFVDAGGDGGTARGAPLTPTLSP